MSRHASVATNKDLVAEAVAAIPLWMAFLDQKEAEQDALIEQMQQGPKRTSYADRATSFLKKKEKHDTLSSSESAPLDQPSSASSGEPGLLDTGTPSTDDPNPEGDIRWAPAAEDFVAEEVGPEEEEENDRIKLRNAF